MNDGFAARLIGATRQFGPLCVGVDPHPSRLPAALGGATIRGLRTWSQAVLEACIGRVGVIKPQVGLFEAFGPEGFAILADIISHARSQGLVVIADAKRGDIGSTASGYADAYLGAGGRFESDAVTVNPYMGLDTLQPFLDRAELHGNGVAVLAHTSNPGAADFERLTLADGRAVFEAVVDALAPAISRLTDASGWSGLMLVAGATGPDQARGMRARAGKALFLVPGYGTQGAGANDAVAGFLPGLGGLEGGVVNASRSVLFPEGSDAIETTDDYISIVSEAIGKAQADLVKACVNAL